MASEKSSASAIAAACVVAVTVCVGCVVAFLKPNSSSSGNKKPVAEAVPKAPATPPRTPAFKPKAPPTTNGSTRATSSSGSGGAAVLARLRQQRADSAAAAQQRAAAQAANHPVAMLYASQTGTAEEIAHSLYDEACDRRLKASINSLDGFKFDNITPEKAPVIVIVAASTGDGDPPDNSARTLLSFRKTVGAGQLKGVKFTVMGLGDSNYTKFMEVPRILKRKLLELGATEFYGSSEADEVDGLEDIVDAWKDAIWEPLQRAVCPMVEEAAADKPVPKGSKSAANLPETYTKEGNLVDADTAIVGVPALRVNRVEVRLGKEAAVEEGSEGDMRAVAPSVEHLAYRDSTGHYSEEKPFWATLKESRLLTSADCGKRVIHAVFDVADAGMQFAAGDAFTVHPSNDPKLVTELLEHLMEDGSQEVQSVKWTDGTVSPAPLPHLHLHHTLQHNLLWAIDLTSPPSKALLVALAASTTDAREAATLRFLGSRDGRVAYKLDIAEGHPNIVQLLRRYRSCRPTIGRLIELLSPLRPRQYSLANAPAAEAANAVLECAFSVVEYETHWGAHGGVATTWLEREGADKDVRQQYFPVCLRPTTGFRVPVDTSAPIIMVGPGTGVAPFRGFLQTRAAAAAAGAALGDSWLFTGNWRKDWDFLYGGELESFVADGTLKHLVLAWSREGTNKVYVQHKMQEHGAALCEALMEKGGFLFVCGDGSRMASDVHSAVCSLLQVHGEMDTHEADHFLRDLAAQKRYLKDVWL